jgi:hypothetical protein
VAPTHFSWLLFTSSGSMLNAKTLTLAVITFTSPVEIKNIYIFTKSLVLQRHNRFLIYQTYAEDTRFLDKSLPSSIRNRDSLADGSGRPAMEAL